MQSIAEKMLLSEPITKMSMKVDPHYRQRKCRPVTLVSGDIRFMRMFAGVLWRWAMTLTGYFALTSFFRADLAGWHGTTSENNCVKTNEDRHILPTMQIFGRDSSFCQYKVCADIRSGSLERRLQTTVGSRVMRKCCRRMLKCIRCVRNKLAVSWDVEYWGD